jgi:hypothetical protein
MARNLLRGLCLVAVLLYLIHAIYTLASMTGDNVTYIGDVTNAPETVPTGSHWRVWELRNDNTFFPLIDLQISENWVTVEGKAIQVRERVTPGFIWPGETFQVSVELLIPPTGGEDHHVLFFTLQRYGRKLTSLPVNLKARTYWPRLSNGEG